MNKPNEYKAPGRTERSNNTVAALIVAGVILVLLISAVGG